MPNKTKKQHFVPQFLLRNFPDSEEKLWAYDKSKDHSFNTGTNNVACDGYFYDDPEIARVTGQEQFLEKAFAKAEGRWSDLLNSVLTRIRNRSDLRLTVAERLEISLMMSLQMARTPLARETDEQIMSALVRTLKRNGATDESLSRCKPPILATPEQWNTKGFHIGALLHHDSVLNRQKIFSEHIWSFLRSAGHGSFYISDHPMSLRPHMKGGWMSHSGIASPGIEIAFPLAHDVLLVMFERTYFSKIMHVDGTVNDMWSPENVLFYNSMQVQSSLRFVYSRTADFRHAKLVCDNEPRYRDPNRKLVQVSGDEDFDPAP